MKRLTGSGERGGEAALRAHYRELEIDTLARTIWGEARGEGAAGMTAVACVILNRLARAQAQKSGTYWWGSSIVQICRKPWQFSCWNSDDPNAEKMASVGRDDLYFATALRIARRALAGRLTDVTCGATHYHAAYVSPSWAKGLAPCARIGAHVFYREG